MGALPWSGASAMALSLQPGSNGSHPRVVIVDDHPTFRYAARTLLAARGYDVVAEAGCAASALDAVERHAPQAVLLDAGLGEDDGFSVCDSLTRSIPSWQSSSHPSMTMSLS